MIRRSIFAAAVAATIVFSGGVSSASAGELNTPDPTTEVSVDETAAAGDAVQGDEPATLSAEQEALVWTADPAVIEAGMSRQEAMVAAAAAPAPQTWAGCGIGVDPNKVVRTYDRSKILRCGNANFGYFHIKAGHGSNPANSNDWMSKAAITGQNWRDVADIGMWAALSNPQVSYPKPANDTTCYSKLIYLVRLSDGKTVGNTYAQVVAGNRSNNVVTSYPATNQCTP